MRFAKSTDAFRLVVVAFAASLSAEQPGIWMLGVSKALPPHLWYLLEGQKHTNKQISIINLTLLVIIHMV